MRNIWIYVIISVQHYAQSSSFVRVMHVATIDFYHFTSLLVSFTWPASGHMISEKQKLALFYRTLFN